MEFLHLSTHPGYKPNRSRFEAPSDESEPSVPYIDVRGAEARARIKSIASFIEHTRQSPIEAVPWLRGVVLITPQDSDGLALKLAMHGIVLLEAHAEDSEKKIIAQFEGQFERLQGAAAGWTTAQKAASSQNPSAPGSPGGAQGTDSPYARKPAYYNEALYQEWLTRLSEPWHEENAWDSES